MRLHDVHLALKVASGRRGAQLAWCHNNPAGCRNSTLCQLWHTVSVVVPDSAARRQAVVAIATVATAKAVTTSADVTATHA